jgi:hypothetical protein
MTEGPGRGFDRVDRGAAVATRLAIVCAVNDDAVLATNLAASPLVASGAIRLVVERGRRSAGEALNAGLDRTSAPIVVFPHQDVFLPRGWEVSLLRSVEEIESRDGSGGDPWSRRTGSHEAGAAVEDGELRGWGVLGIVGLDGTGAVRGRAWSNGLGREVGGRLESCVPAVSLDEMILVVRRASGLRFDEALPGFHLYGTDVVRSALARGLGAWIVDAPAIHNSVPVRQLDRRYGAAYRYLRRKWRSELPLPTLVVPITRSGASLARFRLGAAVRSRRVAASAPRHPDPAALARSLDYECGEEGAGPR